MAGRPDDHSIAGDLDRCLVAVAQGPDTETDQAAPASVHLDPEERQLLEHAGPAAALVGADDVNVAAETAQRGRPP